MFAASPRRDRTPDTRTNPTHRYSSNSPCSTDRSVSLRVLSVLPSSELVGCFVAVRAPRVVEFLRRSSVSGPRPSSRLGRAREGRDARRRREEEARGGSAPHERPGRSTLSSLHAIALAQCIHRRIHRCRLILVHRRRSCRARTHRSSCASSRARCRRLPSRADSTSSSTTDHASVRAHDHARTCERRTRKHQSACANASLNVEYVEEDSSPVSGGRLALVALDSAARLQQVRPPRAGPRPRPPIPFRTAAVR
jgi:hypothetical protein